MRVVTPARLVAAGLVLIVVAAAVLWIAPSGSYYIFLPDRAHPLAPLVHVRGHATNRSDRGGIYFVDVRVRKARLIERLFPGLHDGATLVQQTRVRSTCVSRQEQQRVDAHDMQLSQRIAAAVALTRLGYKVKQIPTGIVIEDLICRAPAAAKLEAGDRIVGVDGKPVRTVRQLRRRLARHRPGQRVRIRYVRGRSTGEVVVRTIADPQRRNRPLIGFAPEQDLRVDLPLDVRIDTRGVGGPSAGLAFALDLVEALGGDADRGYKVAATGELLPDGAVAPVGALKQKTLGAREAGVDVFLVPAGQNAREARQYAGPLRIIPVESFPQALRALATLPARSAEKH
jgi:PDZ domain-containing protein